LRRSAEIVVTARSVQQWLTSMQKHYHTGVNMTRSSKMFWAAGIAVSVLGIGCGSSAVPVDKLTDTQSTIRAAEEVGAEQTPPATLHLKMARDEFAAAQKAANDKDDKQARLYLNQAQSDADLALALAREAHDKLAANQAQANVDALAKQPQ
jgi:hypothetical protein